MRTVQLHEPARADVELFYDSVIRTYVDKRFVPRGWLADRVQRALADSRCRFVLLTAEPGAGKSAFMAWLAAKHPQWPRYFIRHDQHAPLDEPSQRSFLRRIGYQLAATYPNLFPREGVDLRIHQHAGKVVEEGEVVAAEIDRILTSPFYQNALHIRQEVEQIDGRVVGLRVREIVADPDLLPVETLQSMALFNPAQTLQKESHGTQVVVLVDALDELKYRSQRETVLNWLETCPELPSNIRFVLTSRPDSDLLARFRGAQSGRIIEIADFERDANVRGDLERYARLVANELHVATALGSSSAVEAFVSHAVEKANGNLGYLNAIARAADAAAKVGDKKQLSQLLALQALPATLIELYGYFLTVIKNNVRNRSVTVTDSVTRKRFYLDAWPAVYRPVLGVLTVAREPVRPEQIRLLGGIDADETEVDQAMMHFEQFLDHEAAGVRFYHATLPEFLSQPETRANHATRDFAVDLVESHVRVAAAYFDMEVHSLRWPQVDVYALRHLVDHLIGACVWEELKELLTNFDFLEAKSRALSVYDLEADYCSALESWGGDSQGREVLSAFEERFRLESHHINQAPELLFPQLYNHLVWMDAPAHAGAPVGPLHLICQRASGRYTNWLRLLRPPWPWQPSDTERQQGHTSAVAAMTVTPDGSKIISGSGDHTLNVWDIATGRLLRSLADHTDLVTDLAVTPDGSRIVSASSDRTVKVWDLATGRLLRSIHTDSPTAVSGGRETWRMFIALTPDGSAVVSGSRDGTHKVWDLTAGRLLCTLEGHTDAVTDIAVTHDGSKVVSASRDAVCRAADRILG